MKSSVVVKDLRLKDEDKDMSSKNEDKDKESSFEDKDKDLMSKDKDEDLKIGPRGSSRTTTFFKDNDTAVRHYGEIDRTFHSLKFHTSKQNLTLDLEVGGLYIGLTTPESQHSRPALSSGSGFNI